MNNIHGVDIDAQAVEVAQLSLYLKLLEEETTASAKQYLLEFAHTAKLKKLLPDLSKNIVCGNSLVGRDIINGQLFAAEEERKLNPMNFEDVFPETMKRGGFDAVVGNPPYLLLQILQQPRIFEYIAAKYRAARYKIDTYHVFLERALRLTREGGRIGYITPNTFLRNKHARELRRLILQTSNVEMLRLFFYQVFTGASVDTAILVLGRRDDPTPAHRVEVVCSRNPSIPDDSRQQPQRVWREHPENHFSLPGIHGSERLEAKIRERSIRLGDFATAYFGIQTFDREKYVKPRRATASFRPVVDGVHINRYALAPGDEFVTSVPKPSRAAAIRRCTNNRVSECARLDKRPSPHICPPAFAR